MPLKIQVIKKTKHILRTMKINNFEDFLNAKHGLKQEIRETEEELRSHNLFKITTAVSSGNLKDSISETLSGLSLKDLLASPLGNLISTYLLSNKILRKYFIGFTILRQTVPYGLKKLRAILDELELDKDPSQT